MKDKKGFTLVELLSTIAILAIILGIASASYIGIKRHIRRSYYNTLEESILISGGEYFSYTTDKPNIFGDEKKISLEKLVDGKYITEVIDQKGKSCNLSDSYVMAYKNSSDKSDYYVCLKCPNDEYPNDKDNINKACSGGITYSLRMIATIGNTSKLYKEGEYTNQDVKLTFQTFNDVTKIEVKKDNQVVKTCTMTDKNGLKSCSVEITSSGKYEYYGKTGENQTKSGTIDILIDKVKPEFNVYDNESLIDKNEVLKSTESNNKSIIVNVKDIKDLDSGVKTIKYTFDSNYINTDRTKEEFKIEKELNLGKTNLKIEVEDYAGNIKTRVITYQVYKKTAKPDTAYCNTLTYNGKNQTLTKTGDNFTFSNNVKKNAGTYEVVAKLKENYRWQDKTNEDIKINCSIDKKSIAVTWNNPTLTYNGANQAPTPSAISGVTGETINLTRTTGKNAGNYTSTASCSKVTGGSATCNNYTFTNATKDFIINKATPTITLNATSGSVNAGSSITFTEKANVAGSFENVSGTIGVAKVSPASYKGVAANTAKTVTVTGVSNGSSTITITFTPTDKTNYNTKTATYTVKGYKVASIGSCNTLTYNGTSQTLAGNGTGVSYTNNSGTNATSYTVTATATSGYRFSDNTTSKTLSCSIAKRKITIKAKDQKITTSVSSLPSDVTVTDLASGDTLSSIKLTESGGSETGNIIPSNAVIVRGTNTATSNYNITYKNGTYKRDTKICANIYINGASKIGTSTGDKELCCNSTNGSSCAITLPSITPKSGFTALGYSDDGDALTSASYQTNQTVTIYKPTSDDEELASYYAITRSTTRNTYKVTFDLNGATSYTIGGSTYTASKTFSCNADYAYNGDELPDECGITLPTITRSGFTIHGWAEDSSKQSATYKVNQVITLHDDIDLFAITSKSVTLKYNTNSTTTVTTDNLTSKKETKTMFNTDGVMFNIPSYNDGKVCRNNGNDKYHGYQLLGLSSNQSGNNVEFCFGDQIYLESDKTLFLVWQDKYATAVGNVSGNLKLRAGPGTDYDQLDSIAKGDPVYIQSANYTWRKSHTWYPVIYGSKIGWAAGNTSNNSTLKNLKLTSTPNADSCKYAYSCTSNNKLLSITPSDVVLNITSNTSKQKMQQTLSIANQCGPMTGAISSNSSLVTATTSGVVKAVSGSVAVNQTKSAVITFSTKYGCREQVNVLVKNTEATAPDITISVSGDSSTCSGSYIKGATATVTCRSDLPITSYSAKIGSTSYTETTSGNTKTSTISLSSTGSKTINVTCSNAEGTSTASKSVSIKVKNASSSCGCSTYYTASTAGTSCSRCKSWYVSSSFQSQGSLSNLKTRCYTAGGSFRKSYNYNCVNVSGQTYKCDNTIYKCSSFACKTYKTCCHT